MKKLIAAWAGALTLLAGAPASAQVQTDRGFVAINGGAQNAAGSLDDSFTYELYAENATADVAYPGKSATFFDGTAGLRVWRRVGVAVGYSRSTAAGVAQVSARLPHPLFDERHRDVEGETSDISRTESAVHTQLYYSLPLTGRMQVRLSAGPSFFKVEQEIVESVDVTETYPYDTALFAGAATRRADASSTGFNAGVDVSWMFGRRVGLGGMVRYARASADLNAEGSRTVSSDGGGLQFGGGVRFSF